MSRQHWDDVNGEEGYRVDPVGNGPWSYILSEVDGTFLHERVNDHWRITPAFHELEILQVREASTRQAMLFANEAHIIPLVRTQREVVEGAGFVTYRSTLPSIHRASGSSTSETSLSALMTDPPTAPSLLLQALRRLRV